MADDPRTISAIARRLDVGTLRLITLSGTVRAAGWIVATGNSFTVPLGEQAVLTRIVQTGWFPEHAFAATPWTGLDGLVGVSINGRRVLNSAAVGVQRDFSIARCGQTNFMTGFMNHLLQLEYPIPPWGWWLREGDTLEITPHAENWIDNAQNGYWQANLVLGVPLRAAA